ncbi:glycosyltransferase family 2 protein [Pontibaca salina]|uniref:Glycosyltransferase n=1 Tax=Pontibaca salina TaxID=2795731 RepID=A0A934HTZ8_9RHOB|nr:glycosyltransferase family 2 protein [Pontibaca salina]MBI6630740.1 glycosyltransferase [Pontibaca salina]
MRISVITAVFNRAATIGAAIQSVQSQSYGDIEHVIQDGGSEDGTGEIVKRLANDKTRLVSAPDRGIYDAINRGIARASGEVIGLMHSDDVYASDEVLQKVAQALKQPEIDGVYGDLIYVSASEPQKVIRRWVSGTYHPARLKRGWMPPHPTLYLRRAVFEKFGLYDASFEIAADYDAMLRYLGTGQIKLAYIPEVLVKMRVGGESNRSLGRIIQKSREDYRALRRNKVGGAGTLFMKNASKFTQFIDRNGAIK